MGPGHLQHLPASARSCRTPQIWIKLFWACDSEVLKVSKNIKLPSTHIYSKQKHSWSERYLKMFTREEKTILITIFSYEGSIRWMRSFRLIVGPTITARALYGLLKISQCPKMAPSRASSLLKALTSDFTIKNLLRCFNKVSRDTFGMFVHKDQPVIWLAKILNATP